jgi:hypothetical protein
MKGSRPPLYWRTVALAGPGVLLGSIALLVNGRGLVALILLVLASALFFVPWLLAPYSRAAQRIVRPPDRDFERIERFADWLGSLPLFGRFWRGLERMSGNVGRLEAEKHRRWLRDQEDQSPDLE